MFRRVVSGGEAGRQSTRGRDAVRRRPIAASLEQAAIPGMRKQTVSRVRTRIGGAPPMLLLRAGWRRQGRGHAQQCRGHSAADLREEEAQAG